MTDAGASMGSSASGSGRGGGGMGVEILGSGSLLPQRRLTNEDLERIMDTSGEWIVKRTGIEERRIADWDRGEKSSTLATGAMREALKNAGIDATELDMVLVATMTPDMPTPNVSSIVTKNLGCRTIGAIDLNAACSGFIFSISTAAMIVASGLYRTVGLIGVDCLTQFIDYSTFGRSAAILFGDAASAMVLRASDDPGKGLLAHKMHTDANGSEHLFIPATREDFPRDEDFEPRKLSKVQMNGQAVFKFAVSKFQEVIAETLESAGISADQVDHFVCHQANSRILDSARVRFGIPEEKLLINIQRYGNTVAASAPLVFDELAQAGRIKPGQKVMFLAFGAGLTWGSSLWQL